jgi:hypothetical protein
MKPKSFFIGYDSIMTLSILERDLFPLPVNSDPIAVNLPEL